MVERASAVKLRRQYHCTLQVFARWYTGAATGGEPPTIGMRDRCLPCAVADRKISSNCESLRERLFRLVPG
jgi:hypothetical protein